jgi:hexosaminidase
MVNLPNWLIFSFASRAFLDISSARTPLPTLVPAPHYVTSHVQDDFVLADIFHDYVLVDEVFAESALDDGLSLIPPILYTFAEVFASDIHELFPSLSPTVSLISASKLSTFSGYVFLTLSPQLNTVFTSGSPTTEGYELVTAACGADITGSGAKGAFWGSRTLLQRLVQTNGHFPSSNIRDEPDWPTRGIMPGISIMS